MTPEERAYDILYRQPIGTRNDLAPWQIGLALEPLIASAIRQAIQEEREAIIEQLTEYSDGLKEVLPRDALVVMECAQMVKGRQ